MSVIAAKAVRGQLLFSLVDGHLPSGDNQIGLGATTMYPLGAYVGSVVTLSGVSNGNQRSLRLRVVSQVSFPVMAGQIVSLGTGALITTAALENAMCTPCPHQVAC